jgi:hypothetical protein
MSIGTTNFTFKRGDTFTTTVRFRPSRDGVQSLNGATITSRVKDNKSSYFDMTCTLAGDEMSFVVTASSDITSNFSLGIARWDARIDLAGTVMHTPTLQFAVVDEVTKATST